MWHMDRRTNRADMNEKNTGLYEALVKYTESDYYPYHMPGHKRSEEAGPMAQYYGIDITEIDGFDNLHHADGILQEVQQRANRLYGSDRTETFYLVNGSTCGVLASIMAVAEKGDEILIARNCHRSVYHAAILQGLNLHYYYPAVLKEYGICDGVRAEEIARLLEAYPNCRAVVITSPTYEGILSDVSAVAQTVHACDKILIVDEAHGAHLGLDKNGPTGAVAAGADLVIHSLHKTLPAMTQTALLHVQGERVNRGRLRRYLTMLQTSSPSYVLMASMDSCIRYMEMNGEIRFGYMQQQYNSFCKEVAKLRHIRIGNMTYSVNVTDTPDILCGEAKKNAVKNSFHMVGWDIGKLVIYVQDHLLSGQMLYELLRDDYHLQMEMAAESYVLAMMTIMDTGEGWQRLADALCRIDDRIEAGMSASCLKASAMQTTAGQERIEIMHKGRQEQKEQRIENGVVCERDYVDINHIEAEDACRNVTAAQAYLGKWEEIPLAESEGRAAADFINLYPPGIPIVVPGEIICGEVLAQIRKSISTGLQVQGVSPEEKIAVVP